MLSEIDINDWERIEPAKLYEVKNNSPIEVYDNLLWFHHLDGMYSFCLDSNNNVVHVAAYETVTPFRKKK